MGELALVWAGQATVTMLWALGVAASRRRGTAWREPLWVCVVDGALLPVGFLVAYAMAAEPLAAAVLLPLVLLFAEFARSATRGFSRPLSCRRPIAARRS